MTEDTRSAEKKATKKLKRDKRRAIAKGLLFGNREKDAQKDNKPLPNKQVFTVVLVMFIIWLLLSFF